MSAIPSQRKTTVHPMAMAPTDETTTIVIPDENDDDNNKLKKRNNKEKSQLQIVAIFSIFCLLMALTSFDSNAAPLAKTPDLAITKNQDEDGGVEAGNDDAEKQFDDDTIWAQGTNEDEKKMMEGKERTPIDLGVRQYDHINPDLCDLLKEPPLNNEKQPCQVYYPQFDISDHVKRDEILFSSRNPFDKPVFDLLTRKLMSSSSPESSRCSIVTRRGYKGGPLQSQVNQDRSFIISSSFSSSFLMGLFDGHGEGGEIVSQHANINFPKILTNAILRQQLRGPDIDMEEALTSTFLELDGASPPIPSRESGCTATVTYYSHTTQKLYIANTGDSRTILASYNKEKQKVSVVYETRLDKPHLPEEKTRIERAGGQVIYPPGAPTSRVIVQIQKEVNGEDASMVMGLAMSRSIGDFIAKEVGVIATPTIHVVDTAQKPKEEEWFVISASDGIWDHLTQDYVAMHVADALFRKSEKNALTMECEELIMQSSLKWSQMPFHYRDDITIAVSRI